VKSSEYFNEFDWRLLNTKLPPPGTDISEGTPIPNRAANGDWLNYDWWCYDPKRAKIVFGLWAYEQPPQSIYFNPRITGDNDSEFSGILDVPAVTTETSQATIQDTEPQSVVQPTSSTQTISKRSKRSIPSHEGYYIAVADRYCDFKGGIYALHIYCSLVDNTIVGNTMAPLLGIVNAPPSNFKYGDQYEQKINFALYKPLKEYEINDVEVQIRAGDGSICPFSFGRTILGLHFLKRDTLR